MPSMAIQFLLHFNEGSEMPKGMRELNDKLNRRYVDMYPDNN